MRRTRLLGITFGIVLGLVIIAALTGAPKMPTGPFDGSSQKLVAATESVINGASASPGLAKTPRADCLPAAGSLACAVEYTIKEPAGINYSDETILPSTGVFKYAFGDPRVAAVLVTVSGPTTSVGGRSGDSELFDLECSRRAASQIDWSQVSAAALKQLCLFQQYVSNP